ncbi:hypothetical protein G7Y89_g8196 [Cudoniella acicularis]|uniref:Uncharacterized protein n=1 Tax=Cudoniella acicularis TaxID=354080 RepID=A0A8H4RH29_9HELO|nr:hypothetical protein G7Y89_g8196 [Cudoniella acicularis]
MGNSPSKKRGVELNDLQNSRALEESEPEHRDLASDITQGIPISKRSYSGANIMRVLVENCSTPMTAKLTESELKVLRKPLTSLQDPRELEELWNTWMVILIAPFSLIVSSDISET